MSPLRAAIVLVLAGSASTALAAEVTCESQHDRTQACATGGGDVALVRQLSDAACVEGSTWGTSRDGVWVSGGCRAVFDVQQRDRQRDYSYDDGAADAEDRAATDRRGDGERDTAQRIEGSRYAGADRLRAVARRACIDRAADGQSFAPSEVSTNDERWLGDGLFAVDLDTPAGRVACTVDRDGNVQSIGER